jgi:nucleoside-diphosphate-sugar epimerase
MRHFVTGGAGFFGIVLLEEILAAGDEAVVFDVAPLDTKYRNHPRVRSFCGDVREKRAVEAAMQGCDVVHHMAAVLPISRAGKDFWNVNVRGTQNILDAALQQKIRKVSFLSTSAVYGIPNTVPITEATPLTPLGAYGRSKYEAECVCRNFRNAHGLDISIVRPRTILGPGRLGIFALLFEWIRSGKRVYIIGKGDNLFQFVSARDLARAVCLIGARPCRNEDFNIGAENFGTVRGDLEALIAHAGTPARVQPLPALLVRSILRPLDILRLSPLVDWHYRTPHKPFYFDVEKAKKHLGWHAQDGNVPMLISSYEWYCSHRLSEASKEGKTHRTTVKQGILKIIRSLS